MKILLIVQDLSDNGGIQEFAKAIYSELKDRLNLKLFNWKNDLNFFVKVFFRRFPPKIAAYIFAHYFASHFRKMYKVSDGDLLHFWDLEPAMPFLDKRYIVTCHGLEILRKNTCGIRQPLYPLVLEKAQIIHVNSEYTKNLLLKNFSVNKHKVFVIPPCIEFNKLAKIKKIKKNKIIIGTLTRLVKRKNILNIIRALNIIKGKYNLDFIYYLAGNGPEKRKILKALKKASFEWKYFGEISKEKKENDFYPSLDVFVMPALELPNDVEGFGIVYLEANAYGIPVVAAKTGGVKEAVKEGVSGLFASPTKPMDIAIKIIKVLKNKSRYYKSTRNWAKKFDQAKISFKFARVYKKLAKVSF